MDLHIYMAQLCYIVPIINCVKKNYRNIYFYFICGPGHVLSSIILIELKRINIIDGDIIFITREQFIDKMKLLDPHHNKVLIASSNYFKDNDIVQIKQMILFYNHGVDEEAIIEKNKFDSLQNIKNNINLYDPVYKSIIQNIYNLDSSKKTIIWFETTSIWLFKQFCPIYEPFLVDIQNKIFNILMDFKDKYNIILRFHPQEYSHYIETGRYHCAKMFSDNFIINYQPFPVFNLYEIGDLILTSRFSSSGYQAIFAKNKPLVLVDSDFDNRNKQQGFKCSFIQKYNNQQICDKIATGKILGNNDTFVINESEIEKLYSIIDMFEKNGWKEYDEKIDNYVKKNYSGMERINL